MWVEMEQGPRGTVKVTGERDGKETTFEVPLGIWGIKVRPRLFDEKRSRPTRRANRCGPQATRTRNSSMGQGREIRWEPAASLALLDVHLRIADAWIDARRWKEG